MAVMNNINGFQHRHFSNFRFILPTIPPIPLKPNLDYFTKENRKEVHQKDYITKDNRREEYCHTSHGSNEKESGYSLLVIAIALLFMLNMANNCYRDYKYFKNKNKDHQYHHDDQYQTFPVIIPSYNLSLPNIPGLLPNVNVSVPPLPPIVIGRR